MKIRVSIETIISRTRMIVSAFASWPLPPDAKPSYVRWHNLWWWFILIHTIAESTAGLYNMYLHQDDPFLIIGVLAEYSAVMSIAIKMIIGRIETPRLQAVQSTNDLVTGWGEFDLFCAERFRMYPSGLVFKFESLLADLYEFLKYATNEEREVIQFYMDKFTIVQLINFVFGNIGLLAYIVAPVLFQDQILPGSTAYPFSIEPFWIWTMLYVSHIFIAVRMGATLVLDFMYTTLLWFAVARFEIMGQEFQRATNADDIKRCIRKHQELLDYTERLCATIRPMALYILSLTILSVTTGGFTLICIGERANLSWWELMKLILYNLAGGNQLFEFIWPADYLMDMSVKIRDSAYSSAWLGKPEMLKNILFIAHRSEIPMTIEINGFLPALTFELFRNALSATFSYLTMLRAVTAE